MAFPRAAALAELGWTEPERKDWRAFAGRLPAELARYRRLGLERRRGGHSGQARCGGLILVAGGATLALSNQIGLGQHPLYPDGAAPSAASPAYNGPIMTALCRVHLRAAAFVGGETISPMLDRRLDRAGGRCSERAKRARNSASAPPSWRSISRRRADRSGVRPLYLLDGAEPLLDLPQSTAFGDRSDLGRGRGLAVQFQTRRRSGQDRASLSQHRPRRTGGAQLDSCTRSSWRASVESNWSGVGQRLDRRHSAPRRVPRPLPLVHSAGCRAAHRHRLASIDPAHRSLPTRQGET